MTHQQAEQDGLVERYVRRELRPEEAQAFEAHYFDCDECFQAVQDLERFRAGVRDAVRRGQLTDSLTPERPSVAWVLALCASLALAAVAGWLYLAQVRPLREQVNRATADLASERDARSRLEHAAAASVDAPEANLALAMLSAVRSGDKPSIVTLPPASKRLVLWIDMAPSPFSTFRLTAVTTDNQPIATIDGLARGPYGALVASIPADRLQPGDIRIRLTGEGSPSALVGEYALRVEKR